MSILTKKELIENIAAETKMSKAATNRFIESLQKQIMEAIDSGMEVKLTGFASFSPAERAEHKMKNPKTGIEYIIPGYRTVNIKPLSKFKDFLKNKKD